MPVALLCVLVICKFRKLCFRGHVWAPNQAGHWCTAIYVSMVKFEPLCLVFPLFFLIPLAWCIFYLNFQVIKLYAPWPLSRCHMLLFHHSLVWGPIRSVYFLFQCGDDRSWVKRHISLLGCGVWCTTLRGWCSSNYQIVRGLMKLLVYSHSRAIKFCVVFNTSEFLLRL